MKSCAGSQPSNGSSAASAWARARLVSAAADWTVVGVGVEAAELGQLDDEPPPVGAR
jgi:hypothetical protein